MRISLRNIKSDYWGFQEIIKLHELVEPCIDDNLTLDISSVGWIDANMCAPFGAVLHKFISKLGRKRRVELSGLKPKIRELMQRNGFFKNFGFAINTTSDTYGTTIEYQHFNSNDAIAFQGYVTQHFFGKPLPNMSSALARKFRESIAEIFSNSVDHSESLEGIFACGQLFPQQHRLDFSIADLGIGMQTNILQKIGLKLAPDEAIKWAVTGNNTTRQPEGRKPGGLGLKLIKEFIGLNRGKIQIVSDSGYWEFNSIEGEKTERFSLPFPGTVVNIEINTADKQSYRLVSEIDPNSIF